MSHEAASQEVQEVYASEGDSKQAADMELKQHSVAWRNRVTRGFMIFSGFPYWHAYLVFLVSPIPILFYKTSIISHDVAMLSILLQCPC